MLTEEAKNANELAFIELVDKAGFTDENKERFLRYLRHERVNFFNKPYSAHEAAAYVGSLCEYTLKTYEILTKLKNTFAADNSNITDTDLVQVAIFKNLFRAELFEFYTKNVKNETTDKWETVLAVRTKENRPVFGDIGFSSFMIAKKYMPDISDSVAEAICYSALVNTTSIDGYNIRKTWPLVTLAAMAELAQVNY